MIKKLEKACVDLAALRASVRAFESSYTPTSLKEPNTQVVICEGIIRYSH